MYAGTCVLLGSAPPGTDVSFAMPLLQQGRQIKGMIQGDSIPKTFIPALADHFAAGRFPLDRLMTFYDLADINRAAEDSSTGRNIKPVIRMPH